MIGGVLDTVQKLFGKGFLVAAFLPTLLFLLGCAALFSDPVRLFKEVEQALQADAGSATIRAVAMLFATYLLAYMVYGVRTGIHQIYQGLWPLGFRALGQPLLRWERNTLRRYQAELERKEAALTLASWPTEKFSKPFLPDIRAPENPMSRIDDLRRLHTRLLEALRDQAPISIEDYSRLLSEAAILQAHASSYDPLVQNRLAALVEEISGAYLKPRHLALRRAAEQWSSMVHQEWVAAYSARMTHFPKEEIWVRSTRLGNVAMVHETYPLERYGIPLSALWPRLYQVIPGEYRQRLEEANIYLDFTIVMSFFSLVLSFVAAATRLTGPPLVPADFVIPLALLVSFGVFYMLGVQAVRGFGAQVEAAVDLFRLDLLKALHLKLPESPASEEVIWSELRAFFVQGSPPGPALQFRSEENATPAATPTDT